MIGVQILLGKFTVKSAYESMYRTYSSSVTRFKNIWKLEVPQRMRAFTWLLAHDALLTNFQCKRHGLSLDASCPSCGDDEETLLQVLRDYPVASKTWKSLVDRTQHNNFFQKPFIPWLDENIMMSSRASNGASWPLTFIPTHDTL